MPVDQFKCKNCGGAVVFDPASQGLICESCRTKYAVADYEETDAGDGGYEAATQEYVCENCGARIVTTATTAATSCYYCHSPVVLGDRLAGSRRPDQVVPFRIARQEAIDRIRGIFAKAKFLPQIFKDDTRLEEIAGVYFPYWLADSDIAADFAAVGEERRRLGRRGNYDEILVRSYELLRQGTVQVRGMSEPAIEDPERVSLSQVNPFEHGDLKPFSLPYLSGLRAEQRTRSTEDVHPAIRACIGSSASNAVRGTLPMGLTGVSTRRFELTGERTEWRYTLLPVWVLTYRVGNKNWVYAVNGQTGKVCGEVPLDGKRLALLSLGITAACTALGALLGGVL